MGDAGIVRGGETRGHLHGDVKRLAQAEFGAEERFALDEFGDDAAFADIVNRDDVRMISGRRRRGLPAQSVGGGRDGWRHRLAH